MKPTPLAPDLDEAAPPGPRRRAPRPRRAGDPSFGLAAAFVALFLAGLVAPALLAGGEPAPSPFAPDDASLAYAARHAAALRVPAFFQLCAAAPLGAFAALAAGGRRPPGRRRVGAALALFGGFAAAFSLIVAALSLWALSQPAALEAPGAARALHLLAFAASGPGHVVPLGLLVAGVAAGARRPLPKRAARVGLGVAALAGLSALGLIAPAALYLLPLARFSAFAFLLYAGAARPDVRRP